jgi:oligosaccharide repeat unit polymerase
MDMFASTLWLVDESGHHFYGTMYYPLLFMPVPRQLWPDKPGLASYWEEISSPARPLDRAGMEPTMLGEAYANFGLIGIVIVPFIVGYWLGKFYFVAMRKSYFSVYRFMYVTVACCLVQVFRDGLFSAVVFPVVNMMPLVSIAAFSYIVATRGGWRLQQVSPTLGGAAKSAV